MKLLYATQYQTNTELHLVLIFILRFNDIYALLFLHTWAENTLRYFALAELSYWTIKLVYVNRIILLTLFLFICDTFIYVVWYWIVELRYLCSNFLFSENDVGKNIALASVVKSQELNNAIVVQSLKFKLGKDELADFQIYLMFSTLHIHTHMFTCVCIHYS